MVYKLIPSIDPANQPDNLSTLFQLGAIHLFATDDSIPDVALFVKTCNADVEFYIDISKVKDIEAVITLLNEGVSRIFALSEQVKELQESGINSSRFIVNLDEEVLASETSLKAATHDGSLAAHVILKSPGKATAAVLKNAGAKSPYLSLATPSAASYPTLAALPACLIVPAMLLTADSKADPNLIPIHDLLLGSIRTDRPDGLYATVVTDESGSALGLVYSSRESIAESLRTGTGVYQSRERGLWYKGATSGDTQELKRIELDCDEDCLKFTVKQIGRGFCHLATMTCFGEDKGLSRLECTLQSRKLSAPGGSYTARLFSSQELLRAKIMEEAEELCDAESPANIAFEAADLIYFALTKCVAAGVSLRDVERELDKKAMKVKRRAGDAKGKWAEKEGLGNGATEKVVAAATTVKEAIITPKPVSVAATDIKMTRYDTKTSTRADIEEALRRPSQRSTQSIMGIVTPIVENVKANGDKALLEYTHKFEKATSLTSPVLLAPFSADLMQISPETKEAIDISFDNIFKFHSAQKELKPLVVETMPGVVCSRFSRPIERVGLYVPGGTAVLPSTALMLGVPALVAGCKKIVLASPPRADGSITPEIVYIAQKVGAQSIVLAGGAQAVAAMAYGTESVAKVDKILGPGNQFVTAAKMLVSNDTNAGVAIDMPAGPSEVLVIADATSNPAFVASDLLSQAEHGVDSQVVLIAINLDETQLSAIETELHKQAIELPRVDIVKGAIDHSVTLQVSSIEEAMELSNFYAPEHLILQIVDPEDVVKMVKNAGSVFIGQWTPESVGDYSAGVNHSLPTYGYARQYSGVNLGSYVKHITSSQLTPEGLRNVGPAVMKLAEVEALDAHRMAVRIRLDHMARS